MTNAPAPEEAAEMFLDTLPNPASLPLAFHPCPVSTALKELQTEMCNTCLGFTFDVII